MATTNWFARLTTIVAQNELLLLVAISPLMLFPGRYTLVAVAFLVLIWLARWHTYGYVSRRSNMNLPVALLVLMALVGYAISIDQLLSTPKLWGIVLQVAIFFSALNGLHNAKDVSYLALALVLITIGVALVSLIGTNWDVVRLVQLPTLYDRLPTLLRNLPDSGLSPTQDLFHPREVGATMGLLLPFVTAVIFAAKSWPVRIVAILALLLGLFVLLLSQALMGLFGLLVGWAILLIWWRRWLILPFLGLAAALVVLLWRANAVQYLPQLLSFEDPIGLGVALRLDMWSRAVAMLADMPYTGIGLNTFPLVQTHFYTGYALGPEPHAHNLFLQTAVDLGLPGLLAFLWLLVAFTVTVARALKYAGIDRSTQLLLVGLFASVAAFVAGGVLDVMTIGAKPVFVLFLMFGMAAGIDWLAQPQTESDDTAADMRRYVALGLPLLLLMGLLVLGSVIRPGALTTNLALIKAQQVIYSARVERIPADGPAGEALAAITSALQTDPNNPELYGALGSLHAWMDEPEAAIEALTTRVSLDGENPIGRYAPFLGWQRQLEGDVAKSAGDDLVRVYRQWQARFPDRAEGHLLVAIAADTLLHDREQALAAVQSGLDRAAVPSGVLDQLYARLTAIPTQ